MFQYNICAHPDKLTCVCTHTHTHARTHTHTGSHIPSLTRSHTRYCTSCKTSVLELLEATQDISSPPTSSLAPSDAFPTPASTDVHARAAEQGSATCSAGAGPQEKPLRQGSSDDDEGVPLSALRASRISSIDGESPRKRRGTVSRLPEGGQRRAETGVCVFVCGVRAWCMVVYEECEMRIGLGLVCRRRERRRGRDKTRA